MTDPIASRADDIRALLTEHTDAEGKPLFIAVVCNGCGTYILAPTPELLQTKAAAEGWKIADELGGNDYCGRCPAR